MEFLEIDKIYLFLLFMIPGFISIKTYQLIYPSSAKDAKDLVIDAIAYSCINYAFLGFPIYYIQKNLISSFSVFDIYLYVICVLLIFPIILVFLWKKFRESRWVQKSAPHPTALPWDYVFGQRRSYWIIVTLKNGKKIGGLYGYKSFTSNSPFPNEIYLEEHWLLDDDGDLQRKVNDTAGILILKDEISHLELNNVMEQ
ncbi:DUF6338 family protein [Rahnella perminowiae]|uniref:DUF6338 family protein n=1 Tax=Rahnella perminowiae TaxID=2816244 RepID=UPI001EE5ECEA|nr:DUF6338 family protein [Rahnella perminowiae]